MNENILDQLKPLIVPTDSLTPDPDNARKHDDRNIEAIQKSYARFGQTKPIVVNQATGVVVAGNGQLAAAIALGWKHIAAVRVKLTKKQAKAYAIADNRTGELATWDTDQLTTLIADLENTDLIDAIGFDQADVARLLGLDTATRADADAIPEAPIKPTTKPGDLWHLGRHRLLCGDATDPESYQRLIGRAKIHLCHTDPPYNVDQEARGKPNGRPTKIKGDKQTKPDFRTHTETWLELMAEQLEPGRAYYIWSAAQTLHAYHDPLTQLQMPQRQLIVWAKTMPVLTHSDYMEQHELLLYGWKPGAPHYFAPGHDNQRTIWTADQASDSSAHPIGDGVELRAGNATLWITPKPPKRKHTTIEITDTPATLYDDVQTDVWRLATVPNAKRKHLTEKPVELPLRAIRLSTRRNENVLDPFAGAGSTLIAAQTATRKAFCMEIDPFYCDVIVARWENMTGKKASRK